MCVTRLAREEQDPIWGAEEEGAGVCV